MLITHKANETFENNSSNGERYDFPDFSFENLLRGNMPHASPMWRKTVHEKYGYFEEKYRSAADWKRKEEIEIFKKYQKLFMSQEK